MIPRILTKRVAIIDSRWVGLSAFAFEATTELLRVGVL